MKKPLFLISFLLFTFSFTFAQFSKSKSVLENSRNQSSNMINNPTPDQGFTSPTHEKYSGQIVFADNLADISFKKENPSGFKNSFDASQAIYSRVYLDKSIGNTSHGGERCYSATLMYDLYINGRKVPFKKSFGLFGGLPNNEKTFYMEGVTDVEQLDVWTTWRPTFLPLESDEELKFGSVNIMARCFVLSLLELPAGTHEIELKMYSRNMAAGKNTDVLASGKFTLNLTNADKRAMAFKYAPPLPKEKWQGNDKEAIEQDIKRAFVKELGKTPIITGIYSPYWNENTYSLTGQRYRKIAGWAVFEDGDGDGQVPITTFNFISDYSNGSWTALRFDSHCNGCPNWDVEVDAVKAFMNNN